MWSARLHDSGVGKQVAVKERIEGNFTVLLVWRVLCTEETPVDAAISFRVAMPPWLLVFGLSHVTSLTKVSIDRVVVHSPAALDRQHLTFQGFPRQRSTPGPLASKQEVLFAVTSAPSPLRFWLYSQAPSLTCCALEYESRVP